MYLKKTSNKAQQWLSNRNLRTWQVMPRLKEMSRVVGIYWLIHDRRLRGACVFSLIWCLNIFRNTTGLWRKRVSISRGWMHGFRPNQHQHPLPHLLCTFNSVKGFCCIKSLQQSIFSVIFWGSYREHSGTGFSYLLWFTSVETLGPWVSVYPRKAESSQVRCPQFNPFWIAGCITTPVSVLIWYQGEISEYEESILELCSSLSLTLCAVLEEDSALRVPFWSVMYF